GSAGRRCPRGGCAGHSKPDPGQPGEPPRSKRSGSRACRRSRAPMSMSNRARRMAQHHMRHRADAELNLIPLIDILSVMVSFLLVYSTEVEVIQNSKGIEIPQSIAEVAPHQSVVVMITKDDLFVQGERIASVAEVRASKDAIVGP